jgi:hypothetical protein
VPKVIILRVFGGVAHPPPLALLLTHQETSYLTFKDTFQRYYRPLIASHELPHGAAESPMRHTTHAPYTAGISAKEAGGMADRYVRCLVDIQEEGGFF